MPAGMIEIDQTLVDEARQLDQSGINRSNILFSRLSVKIASQLLRNAPSVSLSSIETLSGKLAHDWNSKNTTTHASKQHAPPFCCVEGVAYAMNAKKIQLIQEEGHIVITVPFYCEHERLAPASAENPNGEESPIQKLEECLFLLAYNENISMDLIFVNDVIAEKTDQKDGGSARLFKKAILEYAQDNGLEFEISKKDDDTQYFDIFTTLNRRFCVHFTSCENEASLGSAHETAAARRRRWENRDARNGQLRERKGGAVLAGMERALPEPPQLTSPQRVLRCLVDGDSAHPLGSFVGDAAYAILQNGNAAYLGNLKHPCTCISTLPEESGGVSTATQAKVKNRKLFFSGFIVPFLFPELSRQYNYTGTTQLPVKAFRGDIDFAKAKLRTVQPNVDLGMLAYLCSYLDVNGGSIDSGPVTIRDNVASSTMTTDDLHSEWTKTYGPIFTSAVGLCREFKQHEFERLPRWITSFIENMELEHYTTLFGEEAAVNPHVLALFSTMQKYQGASDQQAVLEELRLCFGQIFDM